jgi:hypothetical protein
VQGGTYTFRRVAVGVTTATPLWLCNYIGIDDATKVSLWKSIKYHYKDS